MLKDNMSAMDISDHLYSLKASGHELLKMYMNILNMIGEMSALEITHRKFALQSYGAYTQNAVDNKRQEIFKAIRLYEQYVLMQKLMS